MPLLSTHSLLHTPLHVPEKLSLLMPKFSSISGVKGTFLASPIFNFGLIKPSRSFPLLDQYLLITSSLPFPPPLHTVVWENQHKELQLDDSSFSHTTLFRGVDLWKADGSILLNSNSRVNPQPHHPVK